MTDETTTTTTAAAPNWLEGADQALVGHAQNKGWDKLDAAAAARAAAMSQREAEGFIGVPADRIIKLPKDTADDAGWAAVHQRLGAPKDAKEYDTTIAGVKFADGTAIDQSFTDVIKALAIKNHWTVDETTQVAKSVIAYVEGGDKEDAAANTTRLEAEKKKLVENWGVANMEANFVIARNAAEKLGISKEQLEASEKAFGFAQVMSMFHTIGTKIGEDAFIRNLGGGNNTTMTREQAGVRRAELQADPAWAKRYIEGGAAENREMQNIIAIEKAPA